jgi:hypothetical protein
MLRQKIYILSVPEKLSVQNRLLFLIGPHFRGFRISKVSDSPTESLITQPIIPEPLIIEPIMGLNL